MCRFAPFRSRSNAVLGCALHARTADTNPGSTAPRGGPTRRSAGVGGGRSCRQAAALGGSLGARGGAPARHLADAAAPHGGPALPALAPFARARCGRLRLPVDGRVPAPGGSEAEATSEAAEAHAGHKVRVTFARPAGRSGSRPWRRARATASCCPATTKLIGTRVSESGARRTTASRAIFATRSSFVIA